MSKNVARFGWPRGLRRTEAAEYIGVSATKFDEMVADGRMPRSRQVDTRRVWDRHELDRSFDDLPGGEDKNPWDDVDVWAELGEADSEPMSQAEKERLTVVATEQWKASLPGKPLGKRERKTLAQLAAHGVGVRIRWGDVRGCGLQTAYQLDARGFLEVDYQTGRESYI